jgi:hypothetical protein
MFNLGIVAKDQGDVAGALALYERAMAARPAYQEARCARGTALLSLGRLAEGWADYEQRLGLPQYDTWDLPQPRWRGEPLGPRRLLVHCEQGFGDTFQFVRYFKLVQAREPGALLATDRSLAALLAQSGYGPLVLKDEPLPPFDVQVPLLSLPHVLGTELATIPADVPYLEADPARVERWRGLLAELPGRKVGIAWQGRKTFRGDALRSIPLESLAPLAAVEGVQLVSLQLGPAADELSQLPARTPVLDLASALADDAGAFVEAAAVLRNLDLMITSDTALAHLAGALGVPVWVALGFAPDWRWMHDRADSPWYPTMRLFRQSRLGDWSDVFARMAAELAARRS